MKRTEQFFVVPFRKRKGRIEAVEARQARNSEVAVELAEQLGQRYGGAIAVGLTLDIDTGEMLDPRELARFGEVPEDFAQAA